MITCTAATATPVARSDQWALAARRALHPASMTADRRHPGGHRTASHLRTGAGGVLAADRQQLVTNSGAQVLTTLHVYTFSATPS
jgi:hypothetical protein